MKNQKSKERMQIVMINEVTYLISDVTNSYVSYIVERQINIYHSSRILMYSVNVKNLNTSKRHFLIQPSFIFQHNFNDNNTIRCTAIIVAKNTIEVMLLAPALTYSTPISFKYSLLIPFLSKIQE